MDGFPELRPRWIEPPAVDRKAAERIARALSVPRPLCELLVRRGHDRPEAARRFLRPRLSRLHDPRALPDAEAAVLRIERALERDEPILVHGDYDADGMSAAALLTRALRELGGRVEAFVPDRGRDGYDLGPAGLSRARRAGAGLIVTADCGVTAARAVEEARAAGIDVVITDHHRPGPQLPEAVAVVNPNRRDASYPFRGLAGVGVAYRLVEWLFRRAGLTDGHRNRHLDLVALGTVADLAPLEGENRALVRAGLRVLEATLKPGLRALLASAELEGRTLEAADVAFRLAPRLNAAGRVGSADDGLRLLLTEDPAEARRLAAGLEEDNRRRRATDREVYGEAEEQLRRRYRPERDRVAVLWDDGWHPGVLGIVASRLVERIHRPVVLVTFEGERGRGSARSIEGYPLHRALETCADVLERFGGHEGAAGLEIHRSRIEAFARRLGRHARRTLPPERLVPELRLDLRLPLSEATPELARALRHLAPFGSGNPTPRLASTELRLESVRRVGREGGHLKARLRGTDGSALEAIGFGLGGRAAEVARGRWEAAFELTEDRWRGRRRLQARLLDLRPDGEA